MVSLTSTSVAWLMIGSLLSSDSIKPKKEPSERKRIKKEEGDAPVSNGHLEQERQSDHSSDETGLSISNISDSATTFPTLGRQMPSRFPVHRPTDSTTGGASMSSSRTDIKREPEDEHVIEATAIEPLVATGPSELGDDEDEDEARGRNHGGDSGIGTSMESEGVRDSAIGLQRRRSRLSGQTTPK